MIAVTLTCLRRAFGKSPSLLVAVLLMLAGAASTGLQAQGFRNPFGVADLADPISREVQQFARTVMLTGDADDRNAEQWAPEATPGAGDTLDGEWFGRWAPGSTGSARIKVVGNRLFALYTDTSGRMASRSWLLEAQMYPNGQVVGSWVQVGNPNDTGPFVGRVVDYGRIDGIWSWDGRARWDFRRRLR